MTRDCSHDGFHSVRSDYDRRQGILRFHWTCDDCGARLAEAHRSEYRPSFEPLGNERHSSASREAA